MNPESAPNYIRFKKIRLSKYLRRRMLLRLKKAEKGKKMDKQEFAVEEYKHLRTEISEKMSNQYKILSLGVGGITVIAGAIFEFEIYELFLVLPFLIFANAYLYRAETHAIVNIGRYIKEIENALYRDNSGINICGEDVKFDNMGWENFLKRETYKPFEYTGDIIFGCLYIMSGFCVWKYNVYYCQIQSKITYGAIIVYAIIYGAIIVYWGVLGYLIHWVKENGKNEKDKQN
jgi:hypothetical protein